LANTAKNAATQFVHFSSDGNLLGRYNPQRVRKHFFNDLVVRKSGEVFSPTAWTIKCSLRSRDAKFAQLKVHRDLFYPNGITLAPDDAHLVADSLGVLRIDLKTLRALT